MTTTLDALKAARETLGELRRSHHVNDEDGWYSCPASGECLDESAGGDCNCGAEKDNARIQRALTLLDAAIQRISDCETCDGTGVCYSEWPVRDSDGGMCDIDGEEHPCPDCCAAIQREEGGGETERPSLECEPERVELGGVRDALSLKHVSDERLDDLCREAGLYDEAQPPSGVVSREKVEMTEQEIDELLEECGSGMGEDGWPMGDAELRALIRNGVFADAPMPSVAARVIASHIALRAALSAPSGPSGQSEGVVSREAAEAACREAARMVGRFVSVPPEPMVPRSLAEAVFWSGFRAGESCAEASHRGECGCDTTAAEEAARILDGEASDGQ